MLTQLELPWLLMPDLPSNKQVNLTEVVAHLATRCLCPWGVQMTKGQPDPMVK